MQLKRQFLPVFLGAASIIIGLGINYGYAQSPNREQTIAQIPPGAVHNFSQARPIEEFPEFAGINLTEEQKEKIQQIQQEILPQFKKIAPPPPELTQEQKHQLESGQPVQITLTPPTPEQKAQAEALRKTYEERIAQVLTPEQRQQFEQNQKNLPFLKRAD